MSMRSLMKRREGRITSEDSVWNDDSLLVIRVPCGTSQHAQDVARFSHDEAGVAKLVEWWIGAWTHSRLLPVALCEIRAWKGAHLSANDHLRLRSVVPSRTNCVVEELREVSFRTAGC